VLEILILTSPARHYHSAVRVSHLGCELISLSFCLLRHLITMRPPSTSSRKPRVTKDSREGAIELSANSTPFPTDANLETIKTWLSAKGNRDFIPFRDAKSAEVALWGRLIDQLQQVTGWGKDWEESWYTVFDDMFGEYSDKKRVPLALHQKASQRLARNIVDNMNAPYKEHAIVWLEAACTALLPRMVYRWKRNVKALQHKQSKGETLSSDGAEKLGEEDEQHQEKEDNPESIVPKATIKRPSKRQKLVSNMSRSSSVSQNLAFTAFTNPTTEPLSLMDHNIVVRWPCQVDDIYTADGEEDEVISSASIAISSLVTMAAHGQSDQDIREDHIEYERFLTILTEAERDVGEAVRSGWADLTWVYSDGEFSEVTTIQNASGFRTALAYMMWQKRYTSNSRAFVEFTVVEKN